MGLSRKNVIVAIGPHLEKIHRGYILSFKTTEFNVVKCADLEEFVDHARDGAALYVLSADTGLPGTSSDDIIKRLSALDAKFDAPILFLRDPKKPTVTALKTYRFTILSRWSEAREVLGIKQLTAATPAKKVKSPEESFRESQDQLKAMDASSNFYIAQSESSRADVRHSSTETKQFFGIKKEMREDGEVAKELVTESYEEAPLQEAEPSPTPEPPAEIDRPQEPVPPETPEPQDLGGVAAVVSEIMAQSADNLPLMPSAPDVESQGHHEPAETKSPLAEPVYTEPTREEPVTIDSTEAPRADDVRSPEEVVSERSHPISGLEEESIVVAPDLRPLTVSTAPPKPKKRPERRRGSSWMVYLLVVLIVMIVAIGVALVAIWWQRAGQGVIVSGPTLGTVVLTDGGAQGGGTVIMPAEGGQLVAGSADGGAKVSDAGVMSFGDGGSSGATLEAGVEANNDVEPAEQDGQGSETTEFVLPFKYVRSQRSPYNINHREFRKIVKFITSNRSLNFEIIGHGAPDENPSFVKRLGYQRAKEARDQICRRGPKRRRFKLRSAGSSVPYEAPGLTGKELNDVHRRVVLRVVTSE